MTSASELFYNRRSRVARAFVADSPAATDLHFRGHSFYNRQRLSRNRRSDSDDCDPVRGSSDVRHLSHRASQLEHGSLRLDDVTSQYNSTSNVNVDIPSNADSRTEVRRRNERLPGAVLLARERLLQRLRGLSPSENRQQSRMPMHVHTEQLDWDAETLIGWLARRNPSPGQNPGVSVQTYSPKMSKPPGLTHEALNNLHSEAFNRVGPTQECSICLETFENGDKLIRLPCSHHFHSVCLDPWVRSCGDCPYCRKCILTAEDNERT